MCVLCVPSKDRWQRKRDVAKFCLQTIQKIFRQKIRSYRRYGNNGDFFYFVHTAARGGTCTFTLKIVSTLIKTAHVTVDLWSRHGINPRPTRFVLGKANKCRWPRRYQVDPWSRGREVARGVLRSSPTPEKKVYFLPSKRDRDFLSPVFYTAKCVCIRRLASARHV